jgi:putative membrane protein
MTYAILTVILSTIAVFVTAHILPGTRVDGWGTALAVAIVLAIVNAFIRPLLLILTLPLNILTLGLFTFVIIAGLVMLVSAIVPGFHVDGFWWALAFALVLAIINGFLSSLAL